MAEEEKKTKSETEPAKAKVPSTERAAVPEVLRPFESLRREVDRLFEDFGRGIWSFPSRSLWESLAPRSWPFRSLGVFDVEPFWRRGAAAPAVDIVEREKDYQITAELPGMDEKDIEVKVSNDMLTIKGEKKLEREEKKKDYYLSERSYGEFRRSFWLPESVDREKIEANFAKGVLTITIPKKPEAIAEERKIPIKTSQA